MKRITTGLCSAKELQNFLLQQYTYQRSVEQLKQIEVGALCSGFAFILYSAHLVLEVLLFVRFPLLQSAIFRFRAANCVVQAVGNREIANYKRTQAAIEAEIAALRQEIVDLKQQLERCVSCAFSSPFLSSCFSLLFFPSALFSCAERSCPV